MTDIWCATCRHELKRGLTGAYAHLDPDDEQDCACTGDGEECQP